MAKFVFLLVCLAAIEASFALKCKICKNPNDKSCKELEDETCPANTANQDVACLYHVYKTSAESKEEIVERKCVMSGKGKAYQCVPASTKEVEVKCTTCDKDFCNENGASRVSLGSVAFVAVAALLVQKLL